MRLARETMQHDDTKERNSAGACSNIGCNRPGAGAAAHMRRRFQPCSESSGGAVQTGSQLAGVRNTGAKGAGAGGGCARMNMQGEGHVQPCPDGWDEDANEMLRI
jgi:hypothetical protein